MGEKQLRLTGSEKVCSGNLEVGDIAVGEYTGYWSASLFQGTRTATLSAGYKVQKLPTLSATSLTSASFSGVDMSRENPVRLQ